MWTLPQSPLQKKIGVVWYGLAVGVGTALCTSATLLLLGLTVSFIAQLTGWIHLGEYQAWQPVLGLEYGFFLGLVIGAFVCWKVWRTRTNS
jgi:hypothetical protein